MKPIIIIIIIALAIIIILGTALLGVRHANSVVPRQKVLQDGTSSLQETQSEIKIDDKAQNITTDIILQNTTQKEAIVDTQPEIITEKTTLSATTEFLSAHDTKDDCWVGFQGKAYDITSYLTHHPGGVNKILPYCGTAQEFENAFSRQHGTSKVSLFMKIAAYTGDLTQEGVIV